MDCECHRPQAQMLPRGEPRVERAAAPMRRRLCQVKSAQGEPTRREWKESCSVCRDEAKGPPADVAVVGRVLRREAHAADQGLLRDVTHALATFSS